MKPATDQELERQVKKYHMAGSLDERIEYAYSTYDHLTDPSLFIEKKKFFASAGIDIEDYIEREWGFGTPTQGEGILPHTGTNHVLVLVFDFGVGHDTYNPYRNPGMIKAVERAFNGFGNPKEYPYESIRNYYLRSSYGKCDIRADVYGWIGIPIVPFGWFEDWAGTISCGTTTWDCYWRMLLNGPNNVFGEFLNRYPELVAEIDWNKYDNDHDGYIEGLYMIWNWNDLGWASPWWPAFYPLGAGFGPFQVDNVIVKSCVWSWYSRLNAGQYQYDPHTDIHETGHLLGLPDLYDYNANVGPGGGVGGLDMMDWNWGDHNAWSKFLLNWIKKPRLIFPFRNAQPETVEFHPSSTHQDAVIVMPNSTQIDPYNDLFVVQYRKRGVRNDPDQILEGTENLWPWPGDGLLIWHVDSTLQFERDAFGYDNSYTPHKYLKLIEADGLNRIETIWDHLVDINAFYKEGDEFSDETVPNAFLYNPGGGEGRCPSGVVVDQIGRAGDTMTARFQIKQV